MSARVFKGWSDAKRRDTSHAEREVAGSSPVIGFGRCSSVGRAPTSPASSGSRAFKSAAMRSGGATSLVKAASLRPGSRGGTSNRRAA